jgi:hypothetical protein
MSRREPEALSWPVTWNTARYVLTSEEDVLAAATAGDVTIAAAPDAEFVCPVIQETSAG